MANSFLSQNWYRIKDLKPRVHSHIRLYRHRYLGKAWYVLNDLVTGKVHRFSPAAYLLIGRLDGSTTIDKIWTDVATQLDEDAPSQDETLNILAQLDAADLIQCDVPPDTLELFERHKKQSRALLKQNTMSPMSFRVPLFDPDAFLNKTAFIFKPVIKGYGILIWLLIVLPALFFAGQHWSELTENISDRVLATENMLLIALCYPFVKVFHEFWHGYVAKIFGSEVREMGIMFLVFFPIPYVDASASAAFRNKWHRAYVCAAGIIMEVFIAAIAFYLWMYLEPGLARAITYNIMLIAGISTVVVNGNPLLKFDGYYMLVDAIEMPNLAVRSNQYLGHLVNIYIFGVEKTKPFMATQTEKLFFLLYAPAAFIYRMIIMVTIALYVATKFFFVGIIFAIWGVVLSLGKPFYTGIKHVLTAPILQRKRKRASTITFSGIAILLVFFMLIPMPLHTDTEGVVWLSESSEVMAETNGFIGHYSVQAGVAVSKGQVLFNLLDSELDTRIKLLQWKVHELQLNLRQYLVTDPSKAKIAQVELAREQSELDRETERLQQLKLCSRRDGFFSPSKPLNDLIGRYVSKGEIIGYVLPDKSQKVRLVVEQKNIDLVKGSTKSVEFLLVSDSRLSGSAKIIREIPEGQYELPSLALSQKGGGIFATDPEDPEGKMVLNRIFQFDATLPEALQGAPFGSRVLVRFEHYPEPLGFQIYRRVRQLFLSQFDA